MLKVKQGYRYVVEFPGCQFVSKNLYPTQGAAIDAMRAAYPVSDYPDAEYRTMADDEPIVD